MISKVFLILILPLFAPIKTVNNQNNVNLEVTNILDNDGQLIISIFNDAEQFPKTPFKVLKIAKQANSKSTTSNFFLEEGQYSIIVLDDSNKNGKMDYRLGVYPKEAFGFSNNAQIEGLKSPSFEDCLFKIKKDDIVNILIPLKEL